MSIRATIHRIIVVGQKHVRKGSPVHQQNEIYKELLMRTGVECVELPVSYVSGADPSY